MLCMYCYVLLYITFIVARAILIGFMYEYIYIPVALLVAFMNFSNTVYTLRKKVQTM